MEIKNDSIYENRKSILFIVILMSFMCCIDGSIVNVALPVISKKLSVTMASIEWVVTSYLMIICSFILVFGRLGDLKGKAKVFKFGIIVFTIGSLMCVFSSSLILLIISRIIQGFGAAASMANNQGIITQVFPQNERGKALGILGSSTALGVMVGPPIGGFIVSILNWKSIFLINVPIGIVTFILALKFLPKSKSSNEKFDIKGSLLLVTTIILLFSSLIGGQSIGYNNNFIIISFIVSFICLILFVKLENKIDAPVLQFKIFKNSLFSLGIFCGFISFVSLNASSIIQPFYLQDTLNISPSATGLFMMVSPFILAIVSPISGNLSDKFGSEILTFLGLVFMSLGLFLMSYLNEHSSIITMMIFVVIISFGNGLFQTSNNSLIMSTVAKNKLGIAGSINALVRNVGSFVGVALATTLLYNRMSQKIGYRVVDYVTGRDDIFIYGIKYVYIILAIICALGALLTAFRLYKHKAYKEVVSE